MTQMATYTAKTECVTAVRLTEHNIREVGELISAEYWAPPKTIDNQERDIARLYVNGGPACVGGGPAYIGDWVVLGNKDTIEVYSDEEFLGKYNSLSEALSESERLTKVYKIISDAMVAGRKGRPGDEGWETVAMLAAKHILTTT
jgi:hypothetical protein